MMLSLGGGALGLIGGYAGIHALLRVSPGNIPRIGIDGSAVSLDWRVSAFTFALAITTGILFGLIPALKSSQAQLNTQINAQTARAGSTPGHMQTQALLVVLEISLAVVLMIGASLLIRSFLAIRQVNPGFDTQNVLTMHSLAGSKFQDQETIAGLVRDGMRRISALPGVEASATTDSLPLEHPGYLSFKVLDRPDSPASQGAAISARTSSSYFETLRIPILRGRGFSEQDDSGPPVVLINDALAKQFWPNGDALNQRIVLYGDSPRQIVGIVADVHASRLNRTPLPSVYIPSIRSSDITWLIRTRVRPTTLTAVIQNELRDASGGLPVARIRTMDEVLSRSIASEHFNALLLAIFGFSALLLAAIGIFGLMAYSVTQRSREIGVRRALGAESHRIRNMIVFHSFRLALAGVACGLLASFGLTGVLRRFLFGIQPFDPLSFAVIPIVLIGVALLAASLPARRATRVDPIEVLRYE
jgi:predicted permease